MSNYATLQFLPKAIILSRVMILFVIGNPALHTLLLGVTFLAAAPTTATSALLEPGALRQIKEFLKAKNKAGDQPWAGLLPEHGDLDFKILGNNWFSALKTWLIPRSLKLYFLPLTIFGKVIPFKTKGEIAGAKHMKTLCFQPTINSWHFISNLVWG